MPPNRVEDAVLLLQVAPKDLEWFIHPATSQAYNSEGQEMIVEFFISLQMALFCLPQQPLETSILLFQYGIIRWILPSHCLN